MHLPRKSLSEIDAAHSFLSAEPSASNHAGLPLDFMCVGEVPNRKKVEAELFLCGEAKGQC